MILLFILCLSFVHYLLFILHRISDWGGEAPGQWWQAEAMFSLRQGMHTLFQRPDLSSLAKLNIPPDTPQTSFYDEIVKMHNDPAIQVKVEFQLQTKIDRIVQENGKSE